MPINITILMGESPNVYGRSYYFEMILIASDDSNRDCIEIEVKEHRKVDILVRKENVI